MYPQTENTPQPGNGTPGRPFSQNVRDGYFWTFQRRYPRTVAGVRFAVTVWLLFLGSVFCANGYPWGALLFAAAALHVALAYRVLATRAASRAR